jgi:hypothetical protein
MTPKRVGLSKKLRFDVFKRDQFTCQYCGATPPKVILQVDHIEPVAKGGGNSMDNLITSCQPCNLGKGVGRLSEIPRSLQDKAADIAEAEEQIKAYNKIIRKRAARIEEETWEVAAALEGKDRLDTYQKARLVSIKMFLEKLPFHEVLSAAEKTSAKFSYIGVNAFKYFCGICWMKIKEQSHGAR